MYHFDYTLVPTSRVTPPNPTISMSSYTASILSSGAEKASTSFADTESRHTSIGLSRGKSRWQSRILSWMSKDSVAEQCAAQVVTMGRVGMIFSYITIRSEDQFSGEGAKKISTEPRAGFIQAFGDIINRNGGWFQRILHERYDHGLCQDTELPLVMLATTMFYRLILNKDGDYWKGSLQPRLGEEADFRVSDEHFRPLAAASQGRSAYMLWLRNRDDAYVVVVFRPVENFTDGRYVLSFSLYLDEECTFGVEPSD